MSAVLEAEGDVSMSRSAASRAVMAHPLFKHIALVGFASFMFYPLAWMLSASFRPDAAINNFSLWPARLHD